jgi:hypothetical protein
MKTIIIKCSSDIIYEKSKMKVIINKKTIVEVKGITMHRVEVEEDEIDIQAKWLWYGSKIYKIPVYDGMILEVKPNGAVNRRFVAIMLILVALGLVSLCISRNLFSLVLWSPIIFPLYYSTLGCKRYYQIREVEK